jgi:carbonic anhydrase/acetyltransferase-like protein (isoleucine patch superfamily)
VIRSLDGVAPRVHPTAFVSEFAYVIGDVEIGEGSSIWPGTVVRADTGKVTIGRYTCVQDNSVVHGDADVVIGDRVVIGHKVLCHARRVGDRVLIGSGATVNDGAEIGEDSLVASAAMVLENISIPPRSLVVGVPGRIRGSVSERHTELIRTTCDHYIENAQRYKRQGALESMLDDWAGPN